jgi:hypothetical protein
LLYTCCPCYVIQGAAPATAAVENTSTTQTKPAIQQKSKKRRRDVSSRAFLKEKDIADKKRAKLRTLNDEGETSDKDSE